MFRSIRTTSTDRARDRRGIAGDNDEMRSPVVLNVSGAVVLVLGVVACSAGSARKSGVLEVTGAAYRPFPAIAQSALDVHLAPHPSAVAVPGLITAAAAVHLAKAEYGEVSAANRVIVTFGDFTDTLAQNRPAFVVTFTGLRLPPIAGPRGGKVSRAVNHEESVVVDASSGAVIEAFSYR